MKKRMKRKIISVLFCLPMCAFVLFVFVDIFIEFPKVAAFLFGLLMSAFLFAHGLDIMAKLDKGEK